LPLPLAPSASFSGPRSLIRPTRAWGISGDDNQAQLCCWSSWSPEEHHHTPPVAWSARLGAKLGAMGAPHDGDRPDGEGQCGSTLRDRSPLPYLRAFPPQDTLGWWQGAPRAGSPVETVSA